MSPMPAVTTSEGRSRSWVAHLRAGGTTPWLSYAGDEPTPSDRGLVPGAQQLELLRRLNEAGRPSPALADRVLSATAVGRGAADLPLAGAAQPRFGPRPVDPATLPAEELLRVAIGLLAQDLAALPLPPPAEPPTLGRRVVDRLARRRFRLLGDPLATGLLRDRLAELGRRPSARPDRVVILAGPLDRMLSGAWLDSCFSVPAVSWGGWLGKWHDLDELPDRLDVARLARHWRREIGVRRVRVVAGPEQAADLLGVGDLAGLPTAGLAELARRMHGPLGMLVEAERRHQLIRGVWRHQGLAPGDWALTVPERYRGWVARRSERLAEELAEAGYADRDVADAVRRRSPGTHTGPAVALEAAIAHLLGRPVTWPATWGER